MPKTITITSGYFNPLHPGHIECFELCKQLGDELRVIINSDAQARQKTGQSDLFQDQEFRMTVVSALKSVDHVMLAIDEDGSVCKSIEKITKIIREKYGSQTMIIFGKGGDRFVGNIPEVEICNSLGIIIKDGLGTKTHNSSEYRAKKVG